MNAAVIKKVVYGPRNIVLDNAKAVAYRWTEPAGLCLVSSVLCTSDT
jgi:hypothetical protein